MPDVFANTLRPEADCVSALVRLESTSREVY